MEILILLTDFSYIELNFCNTIFYTSILLFSCIGLQLQFFYYESLIISWIKNKQTLVCYWNAYLSVGFFLSNGKTEYNYVYVLSNIFMQLFLIAKSNVSNSFFSWISTRYWNNTRVNSHFFLQQIPGLSNKCTFAMANGLVGRFISCYWVRT